MTTTTTSFELLRDEHIAEVNSRARLYRHIKTGAEVLSLENNDENKVFGVTFRTPPADSTGVAHILEHSVLCGSRKYPSKEPFVELIKGSLKTFLNAFTYPDKTCYPVASQNVQDFYNLIDVYLDAVFFPRLVPHVLDQEGWHYELEDINDPLVLKGVVFNEMKGAYSSPDRVLGEYAQQSLFPDTTYGVDSGGHPRHIPDLTFEQFSEFHRTLYHPSNARIYFYGDDDPEQRLHIIEEYLDQFERLEPQSAVTLQPRFSEPRRLTYSYIVDEDEANGKQSMVSVNWMLTETNDPQRELAVDILDYILTGTPAAPLYKALIDSGLGEDLTPTGYSDELRQGMFMAGLKGIAAEDANKVEALILDTLRALADNGLDPNDIEAALNTTEFALREQNTGSFPRGLVVMLRALNTWLHGDDPLAPLAFEQPLASLKQRLARGEKVFENLIRELLLENPHRTTVILNPDPDLARQEAEREQQRLDAARAGMSEADLQAIIANTRELKRRQEAPDSPEALATIPSLKLEDLERQNKTIPVAISERQETTLLYHDLPTNGIFYVDLALNLHVLPQELIPYGELFGRLLREMGTASEDFVSLSQRIGRTTGGIGASAMSSVIPGEQQSAVWLIVRGKATCDHVGDLFAILRDMLLTARLDNRERFKQIVLEEKAGLESSI
ncbi:MAG: peptidase M16, partial [Chloroflexaceae bacterium]|nr:peptidase M16 [Chloroflexaceae bacterium]